MCNCEGNKMKPTEETAFQGAMGAPVGFDVLPQGSPLSEEDMLQGIFQRMGIAEDPEEEMPMMPRMPMGGGY